MPKLNSKELFFIMMYKSTRDAGARPHTSAEVIKKGLADDGGLFMPETIPQLSKEDIKNLCSMNYPQRAAFVLSKFLTDYNYDELLADCKDAYRAESFPGGPAPLIRLTPPAGKDKKDEHEGSHYILELWHGPTAAFKDMALQIMPRLLTRALAKTGEKRRALILVATSGDTGKAALEGYRDIDGTKIEVFYPEEGVSRVQKLQMVSQAGANVEVLAVRGNFDDCQSGVKRLFSDKTVAAELDRQGYFISSANSINWGRLAPQIVYYVSAYCDLVSSGDIGYQAPVNICVPTGNFGNILAAYFAKLMGLPLAKLICASNSNNVLTEFLRTGIYDRNRDFHLTMSPSMDILISSNLERLLCLIAGAEKTKEYMDLLNKTGKYSVSDEIMSKISETFVGYCADEGATSRAIRQTHKKYNYLSDTHTAVALDGSYQYRKDTRDTTPIITVSTASPYKFAADVYRSLTGKLPEGDLEALDQLSRLTNVPLPFPLENIGGREIRFKSVIDTSEMKDWVINSL